MKAIPDDIIQRNKEALDNLFHFENETALSLLKKNVKCDPCLLTLHNLGVFYAGHGIPLKNSEGSRIATKLGITYLLKAHSVENSFINLNAIAVYYSKAEEYEKSVCFFEQAFKEMSSSQYDYLFYSNFGKALYLTNRYEEAAEMFLKAYNTYSFSDEDEKLHIYISYLFALFYIDMESCWKRTIDILKENEHKELIFILLYLCHDYQNAHTLCLPLFKIYDIDTSVIAMIFDCLFELGLKDDAEKCFNMEIKHLQGFAYNTKNKIKEVKLAYTSYDMRKKLIEMYRYMPMTIKDCYYIGCCLHHPL